MKMYTSYETGIKGKYTLEQMMSLYKKEVIKSEYPTFDIWLADMLKSGVFVEVEEAYHYCKTAKKTAEANNLVFVDGNMSTKHKMLFDFALLETFDISEEEKDIIKRDAMAHCSIVNNTAFAGSGKDELGAFVSMSTIVDFAPQKVYDAKTYKLLYVILCMKHIKYWHGERESIYDKLFDKNIMEFEIDTPVRLAEEIEI